MAYASTGNSLFNKEASCELHLKEGRRHDLLMASRAIALITYTLMQPAVILPSLILPASIQPALILLSLSLPASIQPASIKPAVILPTLSRQSCLPLHPPPPTPFPDPFPDRCIFLVIPLIIVVYFFRGRRGKKGGGEGGAAGMKEGQRDRGRGLARSL